MGQIIDYHGDQQREAEFEESLQLVRNVDSGAYMDFKSLTEGDGLQEYNGFKEEVESMVQQVNALQGAIYTEEGKKALIQENLGTIRNKYVEKEANRIASDREKLEKLRTKLSTSIDDASYTSPDAKEKMQDLEAQTRSKLAFASQAREVESILRDLVTRGENDKTAAVFVSKYAYLFADKASYLAKDSDKNVSLHHIKTLVDKAESIALNPKTKARMEMLKRLEHKGLSTGVSKRLIDMNIQALKKRYQ